MFNKEELNLILEALIKCPVTTTLGDVIDSKVKASDFIIGVVNKVREEIDKLNA